ncbi:MAG TPA: hypothetical protein VGL53_05475 [Bryobacteraceae bacterium]
MRRTLSLLAISTVLAGLALAEGWSGKLLDASCYDQQKKSDSCDATSKTVSFALESNGTVYKLDSVGNSKAVEALRNRADRADPNQPQSTQVIARVDGVEKGGIIAVESLDVQ